MSKNEKRFCSLSFARSGDSNKELLFRILEQIQKPTKSLIISQLSGNLKRNYQVECHYLYKHLLDALSQFNEEHYPDLKLWQKLRHARLLIERCLYTAAASLLDSIIADSKDAELWTLTLDAIQCKRKIALLQNTGFEHIQAALEEELELLNTISNYAKFNQHRFQIAAIFYNGDEDLLRRAQAEIQSHKLAMQTLQQQMIQPSKMMDTHLLEVDLLTQTANHDYIKNQQIIQKQINIYQSNPIFFEMNQRNYFATLIHQAVALEALGEYDDEQKILLELCYLLEKGKVYKDKHQEILLYIARCSLFLMLKNVSLHPELLQHYQGFKLDTNLKQMLPGLRVAYYLSLLLLYEWRHQQHDKLDSILEELHFYYKTNFVSPEEKITWVVWEALIQTERGNFLLLDKYIRRILYLSQKFQHQATLFNKIVGFLRILGKEMPNNRSQLIQTITNFREKNPDFNTWELYRCFSFRDWATQLSTNK